MRAPRFWYAPPGWQSMLLAPLGAAYACLTAQRLRRGRPTDPGVPVICVGNVNAGGTGKTPTVIALAERLAARGIAVHIVSRGYGGRMEGAGARRSYGDDSGRCRGRAAIDGGLCTHLGCTAAYPGLPGSGGRGRAGDLDG